MRTINLKSIFAAILLLGTSVAFAQQPSLQFFRPNSQEGVNTFETGKQDTVAFEGVKVRVGGDFALQFQSLDQSTGSAADTLSDLGSNFNLPTANLNLDVQLHDGLRMHLRTYLSSRHHNEAWVKGGYLQMDKLDFIKPGFMGGFMEIATITVGLDEINYGDAHFRRSDNARAIFNPFVGNYIMDSFTTEAFGELTLQKSGFIGVLGVSNGKLNQSVVIDDNTDNKLSFYGKLGYDNQISDDLRVRLTGSWYMNNGTTTGTYLYSGDRAGSRYYSLLRKVSGGVLEADDFRSGRFNPGFKQISAFQINPFVKFQGLEFFGIYEIANNSEDEGNGSFTQVAGELLYRFGGQEQFYLGGRYNVVSGKVNDTASEVDITRLNLGGGWFMTKNVLAKVEYVTQSYGDSWAGKYSEAQFDGIVVEATIGF